MCCRFGSRGRCCVCTVVVFHLVIVVSLVVALVLRYVVYKDIEYLDMATDQRVLHRGVSSIFCTSHSIESVLTEKDRGMINTKKEFHFYSFKDDPRHNASLEAGLKTEREKLVSKMGFAVKESKDYVFYLMENSTVSLELCKEPDPTNDDSGKTLYYYYITAGMANRAHVLNALKNGEPLIHCDPGTCIHYNNISLPNCTSRMDNYQSLPKLSVNDTDDYTFILFNPSLYNETAVIRGIFDLNRRKYSLHSDKPATSSANINPEDFIIVEFDRYGNDSSKRLVNIQLTYECNSYVIVYMAFFFWLPLLLLVILGVVALYRQSRTGEYNLLASHRDTHSYGSLQS